MSGKRAQKIVKFDGKEYLELLSDTAIGKNTPDKDKQQQRDEAGKKKVRCSYCLKRRSLRGLTSHVRNMHSTFFTEKKSRSSYIAPPQQIEPLDPDFHVEFDSQNSDDESYSGSMSSKRVNRQTEDEQEMDLAKEISDLKNENDGLLSQDDTFWYTELTDRLDKFESASVVKHLTSKDAKEKNSLTRTLIESAVEFFESLTSKNKAIVVFSAVALGDDTLAMYKSSCLQLDTKTLKSVQLEVAGLLQVWLGFNNDFAVWISQNFQRFNEHSLRYLSEIGVHAKLHVIYSLVTDLSDQNLIPLFEHSMKTIKNGFQKDKQDYLQSGVMVMNDCMKIMSVKQLKEILSFSLKTPVKQLKKISDNPLCEWKESSEKQLEEASLADSGNLLQSQQKIFDLNKGLAWLEEDVIPCSAETASIFDDISLPLNSNQRAVAATAFLNHERERRQIFIVPAGRGKSRIHAALTHMFLKDNAKVKVIFENKGLMNRDKNQNQLLKIFSQNSTKNWHSNVSYQVGIGSAKNLAKTIVIIDESDAVMFKNLLAFHKATSDQNIFVIGLTATAYDGKEEGLELSALKTLGYKVYRTCEEDQMVEPPIHETKVLKTVFEYHRMITWHQKIRPVLVYAKGKLYDDLKKLEGIEEVTENMNFDALRNMGEKKGNIYPTYLTDEKGMRGHDYRNPGQFKGITLIIGASFNDKRDRIQGLMRVGRHGDDCYRIQDSSVEKINATENAIRKGKLSQAIKAAEEHLRKEKEQNCGLNKDQIYEGSKVSLKSSDEQEAEGELQQESMNNKSD